MSLRKIIKMRGSFPNDEAAFKLLYLALRNASKKWTIGARVESALPVQNWHDALNRLIFSGRSACRNWRTCKIGFENTAEELWK